MYKKLALASILVAAACGTTPCRDRNLALIGTGGFIGWAIAAADKCDDAPPQPEPIAALPAVGLVELPAPDLATVPVDMGSADLMQQPDLAPADKDHDGIPDNLDRCPTTPAGSMPDPDRRGCPAPFNVSVTATNLQPLSGSWAISADVWKSAPGVNWTTYKAIDNVLVMSAKLPQLPPADLMIGSFTVTADLDLGTVSSNPVCAYLGRVPADFVVDPSNAKNSTCIPRVFYARIYDADGNPLSGGADCATTPGLNTVKCTMAYGTWTPLPSGATSFAVHFVADGTVSVGNLSATATVQVSLR